MRNDHARLPSPVGDSAALAAAHTRPRKRRVLLAEDDSEMRQLLAEALRADGYEVLETEDGLQLRNRLDYSRQLFDYYDYDLIIADLRMPRLSSLEVLSSLPKSVPIPPFILITAFASPELRRRAAGLQVLALFDKPVDLDALRRFVAATVADPDAGRGEDRAPSADAPPEGRPGD